MRQISIPAAGMFSLAWLYIFDDDTWKLGTHQFNTVYTTVSAPQSLHSLLIASTGGLGGGLNKSINFIVIH
jgi:hypothetical protein